MRGGRRGERRKATRDRGGLQPASAEYFPFALSLSKPVLSACKAVEGGCSFLWRRKEERCFDRPSTNGSGKGRRFQASRHENRPGYCRRAGSRRCVTPKAGSAAPRIRPPRASSRDRAAAPRPFRSDAPASARRSAARPSGRASTATGCPTPCRRRSAAGSTGAGYSRTSAPPLEAGERAVGRDDFGDLDAVTRSEEHTSELQSLM